MLGNSACALQLQREICVFMQLQIRALVKMGVFHPSRGDRFTFGSVISHTDGRGSPELAEGMGHCMFYCKTHIKPKCLYCHKSCLLNFLVFSLVLGYIPEHLGNMCFSLNVSQ